MDRQLQERVNITNFKRPMLMNRRNEMGGVRVDRQRYMRWGATRCPDWRSPLPNAILQAIRGEEGGENQVGGAWGRLEDGGSLQSF